MDDDEIDASDDDEESEEEESEEGEELPARAVAPGPGQKRKEATAPAVQPVAKQPKQATQTAAGAAPRQAVQAAAQPAAKSVTKQAPQPMAKAPAKAEAAKPAKEAKKRTFPNGFEIEVLKQVRGCMHLRPGGMPANPSRGPWQDRPGGGWDASGHCTEA